MPLFSYLGFPNACRRLQCDVAFIPGETCPFFLKMPVVMSAFDFFHLKYPHLIKEEFSFPHRIHHRIASRLHYKRAALVFAISEDTKNDLMELCKVPEERIVVTPLGYDKTIFKPYPKDVIDAIKAKYHIDKPYFINVSSGWGARKNLRRILGAFGRLHHSRHAEQLLLITGNKGNAYPEMMHAIRAHGIDAYVRLLGYLPQGDLAQLIAGADALVFPSLYEGFGLPVIEAMGCGCPIITSNNSALKEVAKDAAILVDPLSSESIEEAMSLLLESETTRNMYRQKSITRAAEFSFEKTARLTLEGLHGLMRRKQPVV